ncbi:glycosyltransferase family 4 protein [Flavobacteriaceae bacterium KMM 6898]|nr:glycosyltransferase family 4 protein [Flavobacteriaceae bacterium KMM 6898]
MILKKFKEINLKEYLGVKSNLLNIFKKTNFMDSSLVKLNIAFLLGRVSEKGGISRVASIISKELLDSKTYNKIHIISYHPKEKSEYGWSNKLVFHDLLNKRLPMKKGFIKGTFNLIKVLKINKIDVLIVAGHNVGPLAVVSSWFSKTKIVYWSHSSYKASTNSRFRLLNEKFTAIFCKCIVSLTKTDEKNYKKETLAQRVVQIYNPIDPVLVLSNHEYKLKSKAIISVGRLTHQKNFLLLVEVAKIVLEKHKTYCWHIYGSGEEENEIQKKISMNNLEGRLKLMGQSNNLYNLYPNYSIMVMTSRYEGFPMTLIEGMACKLPLVSFDIPTGPNEIIRDSENGFLIEPFNIIEMANSINKLIENPKMRLAFSNENENFSNEFSIQSIKDKWITLINKL